MITLAIAYQHTKKHPAIPLISIPLGDMNSNPIDSIQDTTSVQQPQGQVVP